MFTVASSFISLSPSATLFWAVFKSALLSTLRGTFWVRSMETQTLPSLAHSASLRSSSHMHYQKSLQPPPHSLPNSSQPGLFSKCLLITHGKLWVLCIQPDLLSPKNYLYVARFYFHFETENTTSASLYDFSFPTLMQILNSILIGLIKIWSWAEWLHEG